MEEESYIWAQSWGGGKGEATYYRVPPRLGICKEKKSSHFTKGHLAAAWPCPTPLQASVPSTAPRVEVGPSSDLTLENSGWVSGPGHRASLPRGSQRTGQSSLSQPPSPSAHRTPPLPPTPTHAQEWFRTSRRGSGRVRSCCHRLVAARGRKGQSPSEQHVKLNHTGGPHGDRERVVGPEDPF